MKKVVIVTAAYNAQAHLEETIRSVLAQTVRDFAYVIVDDSSSDSTTEIAQRYCGLDSRIHLVRNEINLGVGLARNRGVAQVAAPYVSFLDSDDQWEPTFLEEMIRRLESQDSGCIGVFCRSVVVDEQGHPKSLLEPAEGQYDFFNFFRSVFPPGNGSAFMLRRSCFEEAKGFSDFRSMEDLDLYLRMLQLAGKRYFDCLPRQLVRYRHSPQGLSHRADYIRETWDAGIEGHVQSLPAPLRWEVYESFSRCYGVLSPGTQAFASELMRKAILGGMPLRVLVRRWYPLVPVFFLGWRRYLELRRFLIHALRPVRGRKRKS